VAYGEDAYIAVMDENYGLNVKAVFGPAGDYTNSITGIIHAGLGNGEINGNAGGIIRGADGLFAVNLKFSPNQLFGDFPTGFRCVWHPQ